MISSIQGVGSIVIQSATESINVSLRRNESTDEAGAKESSRAFEDNLSAKETGKSQGRDTIELSKLADKLRELFSKEDNLKVEFSKDKSTEKMVFKLIDSKSNEVLKQIPPEIVLKISKYVSNKLEGGEITNAKI